MNTSDVTMNCVIWWKAFGRYHFCYFRYYTCSLPVGTDENYETLQWG